MNYYRKHETSIKYGALVGVPIREFEKGNHPHVYIYVNVRKGNYRSYVSKEDCYKVAVNVQDYSGKNVFFAYKKNLHAAFLQRLQFFSAGEHVLEPTANSGAIDYVRGGFIKKEDFREETERVLSQRLHDIVYGMIAACEKHPDSKIFCFGSMFPGGIHDIHMNQGESRYRNKQYQDGALIFFDANKMQYNGAFFYFQEESSAWYRP
ncbi:uncharacterized protein TRIADDRAFT_52868 [Trichoplax adhaerens]|uniref:DUF2278 family protein n=1 Tax=Trichoplax adhaerens TaxID=10228 RepID=B3RMN7_TRIAD|nr:predicted protein [Trichoplax adhaerens]EDV27305.1 predicted protein [Trichoplax adhaerens]|eukprot:XP_002109139.1 predicted protein [Trichoplax adhaerens]